MAVKGFILNNIKDKTKLSKYQEVNNLSDEDKSRLYLDYFITQLGLKYWSVVKINIDNIKIKYLHQNTYIYTKKNFLV